MACLHIDLQMKKIKLEYKHIQTRTFVAANGGHYLTVNATQSENAYHNPQKEKWKIVTDYLFCIMFLLSVLR